MCTSRPTRRPRLARLLLAGGLVVASGPLRGHGVTTAAADPRPPTVAGAITERARLEIKPGTHPITAISIDNPLGNVRIEGYDGTALQIETEKHAPTDEAIDRLRISLIPNPDGSVRITTTADGGPEVAPVGRGQVRIDLVVHAPRDARVEATASTGTLEVANMDAGSALDTSSGRISVKNVSGGVSTSSISGATRLESVFGTVDAQTLSSDLVLDSISGQRLVASATHGSIAGRRVRSREITLTTTAGAILLEAEPGLHGRIVVASLGGDVDVRVRRTGPIVVRARGARVSIGASAHAAPDGWTEASVGTGAGAAGELPAFVELQSRRGNVQLHLIDPE